MKSRPVFHIQFYAISGRKSVSSVSTEVEGTYSEEEFSKGDSDDDEKSGTKGIARFGSFTDTFLLETGAVVVVLVSLCTVLMNFEL